MFLYYASLFTPQSLTSPSFTLWLCRCPPEQCVVLVDLGFESHSPSVEEWHYHSNSWTIVLFSLWVRVETHAGNCGVHLKRMDRGIPNYTHVSQWIQFQLRMNYTLIEVITLPRSKPRNNNTLLLWECCSIFYSLNKKVWICSLFKEWILEKSEIRVNLEWTFVLFTHFGVTLGSLRDSEWSLRSLQNEWITQNNVHSKFTPNSL